LFLQYPETLLFGEDSAKKGGVYGVTQGLQKRFGIARVFDTLLDETTIPRHRRKARARRIPAAARDPVPRVPAQRARSAARRSVLAAVLLAGTVLQSDGRALARGSRTRRDSAATSTTTTRSARCATSRA
jgi:hypothetical protein